jgi:hypothetical protein
VSRASTEQVSERGCCIIVFVLWPFSCSLASNWSSTAFTSICMCFGEQTQFTETEASDIISVCPHRYLYEFLYGWIVSALTRADSFIFEQECTSEQYKNLSRGQKKTKLKKKKMKPYSRECMSMQALQNICGGYYKALAGFLKAERIPQPLLEFDHEQIRYEHRFAPFAELATPPPISYHDFCSQKNALLMASQEDLFLSAAKHFQQARAILELIPNLDTEVCYDELIALISLNVKTLFSFIHS